MPGKNEGKQLKIAIVHFTLSAPMGDTRCVGSFAAALQMMGHNVMVFTPSFDPGPFSEFWKKIKITIVPQKETLDSILKEFSSTNVFKKIMGKLKNHYWSVRTAKNIAQKLPPDIDVLDCHNGYAYQVARFYKRINPHVKAIWTMHDPPANYRPKKNFLVDILSKISFYLEPMFEKKFYDAVDHIVVMDERSFPIAQKFCPSVSLLYLGIEYSHFFNEVKYKSDGKTVRLIAIGALSPYRRFEDIIMATKELRRRGYDARADIICRDFWENKGYRSEFEKFVQDSGIKNYIKLDFKGVNEKELLDVFWKSDIFIFPNHIEIWGLAAFEAMAAGLPLIVSSVTSVAGVLKDGENALFVDPLQPNQIADKVEQLTKDRKLYVKIASNGQKFTKDHISWDAYVRDFTEIAFKK